MLIRIRGVVYPSAKAAGKALGVHWNTILRALDDGRIDEVGIVRRIGGRPGTPCTFRGRRYPSMTAAAREHGVTLSAVSMAVRRRKAA